MNSEISDLRDWGPLKNLSEEKQKLTIKKIKFISLKMGHKISDFDDFPPGIILLKKGKVREIFKDKNNDLYTISTYKENQIVGLSQILRGQNNFSLIVSEKIDGFFIPTIDFLEILIDNNHIFSAYKKASVNEIISCLINIKREITLETKELINFVKKDFSNINVEIIKPGKNIFHPRNKKYIVSTNNIFKLPLGSIIDKDCNLEVLGKIPGRLLPFESEQFNQLTKYKDKKDHTFEDVEINKKSNDIDSLESIKIEAFEDLYGNIQSTQKYPHQNGKGVVGEILACLRMLARFFDLPFNKELINSILSSKRLNLSNNKFEIKFIAALFEMIGINTSLINPKNIDFLRRSNMPLLCIYKNNLSVIWKCRKDNWLVSIPSKGKRMITSDDIKEDAEFFKNPKLTFTVNQKENSRRFGFSWFLPFIRNYKYTFIQIILASFFVQLLGLFNPLLIQQIIDAVINQGNLSSLNILGTVLIAMALAQALLGVLRTYIFTDTTNRIDILLGTKVINHLLKLPMKYFFNRRVGEISGRINELENIRQFLTSTSLTALLDAFFSVIYIAVMVIYSLKLTILSLITLPLLILISFTLTPIIREQLRLRAEARAKVQSHLVETISGIETVKNQGTELASEWRWKRFYGKEINSAFKNTITTSTVSYLSQFLAQISGLIVIWAGSILVIKGQLTIGQLIAFRILSGYVNTPLLRLSSIWHDFQETSLSIKRLSDVIDTDREDNESLTLKKPPLPSINGKIEFQSVSFRYSNDQSPILSNISLQIYPRNFIGIVGESGSGKSTLLKLLPRILKHQVGKIFVDDFDISKVNLQSLRSQFGIVSQENILFDDSIQNNIALTKPEAEFNEIIKAAKFAEAHDFINKLSNGYATNAGEKGTNLSGGQRQRITIARTLIMNPKIIILDEATSSLDVRTESKILNNIFSNFKDSTIIFITHRLFNLKNADNIFVFHNGLLAEEGRHSNLIEKKGIYKNLYDQQMNYPN